jgi:retinol-binding protein 3
MAESAFLGRIYAVGMRYWTGMRLLVSFSLLSAAMLAQGPPPGRDIRIDAATRHEVIASAATALSEDYVFPDVARKMEQAIRAHQTAKEYDAMGSAREFAEALTRDLQAVSHDKHLRVMYSAEVLPPRRENGPPPPDQVARQRALEAQLNFGFDKVERLPGNIGYLELRGFMDPEFMGDTAAAAMNFLANSEAVIIDLRRNGGGSPGGVALICSYLFGAEPVHLNDLDWRRGNQMEVHQWWTLPYVPGKRLAGKDVYVLTSHRTFSAAEEFVYDLRNLKRATIVGETTGGGANPGGIRRLTDHFMMFVPSGRAVNPVTKTNWEGTGIAPDVSVPAAQALAKAHLMALEKELPGVHDPMRRSEIAGAIEQRKTELAHGEAH